MKAIRLRTRGGPESLAFKDAPTPCPGPGEVLVRVHAAAVTPSELLWVPTWTTRSGEPRPLPVIPTHDVESVTGRPAASARDFVARHAESFASRASGDR